MFFAQAVALGVRGTIGLLVKPWETEFGWDRAAVSLTASLGFVVYGRGSGHGGALGRPDRAPRDLRGEHRGPRRRDCRRQLDRDSLAGVPDLRRPDDARRRRRLEPHLRRRGRPLVHRAPRPRARRRLRRVGGRAAGAGPRSWRPSSAPSAGGPRSSGWAPPSWWWRSPSSCCCSGMIRPRAPAGPARPRPARDRRWPSAEILRHANFWWLALSFFVCGVTTAGLIDTHFIPYAQDHHVVGGDGRHRVRRPLAREHGVHDALRRRLRPARLHAAPRLDLRRPGGDARVPRVRAGPGCRSSSSPWPSASWTSRPSRPPRRSPR